MNNTFGHIFKLTSFGESHGGGVIEEGSFNLNLYESL